MARREGGRGLGTGWIDCGGTAQHWQRPVGGMMGGDGECAGRGRLTRNLGWCVGAHRESGTRSRLTALFEMPNSKGKVK